MGMSMHVVGFVPPDEEWQKLVAAWHACDAAGIEKPRELLKRLGRDMDPDKAPDPQGREASAASAVANWKVGIREGYEVDLRKLPPEIKVLRFYCSW
jgi:hypothetical protein